VRPGPIHAFLAEDHERLDALLRRATGSAAGFDAASFEEFRAGILRHIGIEEKILLKEARRANGGEPLPMASRLRVEHGAIAMLLVPTPSHELVAEIRSLLSGHNALEEGAAGLYEVCDRLMATDADAVLERLRAYPPVKVAPHYNGPGACRTVEDALRVSSRQRR
jgi:hypothetical protein